MVNLTSTGASMPSFLTAWATGALRPGTSNVNAVPGTDVANLALVTVGVGGRIDLHNENGTGDVVVDLVAVLHEATALGPRRIADTRTTLPLSPGETRSVATGLPEGSTAVVNLTSTGASAPSFLSVWSSGRARPATSNLNAVPGTDVANLVVVTVGSGGHVDVYNDAGSGDVVVDLLATLD